MERAVSKHYVVEKTRKTPANGSLFRDSTSGAFSTRVMSRDSFDKASGRANHALEASGRDAPKR